MNQNNIKDVNNYLKRFDEILDEMAKKMLSQNITNSITVNFIVCMIPHHQAAIYMCENLLKYTNYMSLRQIANNIIQMQTKGIDQMEHILYNTKGYTNSRQNVYNYMNKYYMITNNMIAQMRNSKRTQNINLNFTSEMIPHHEGAIKMCNNLLQYKINPKLEKVAKNIIQEQSEGVKQLERIEKMMQ